MCFRPAAIEMDIACLECGTKVGAQDKVCPACGALLPDQESASPYFVPGAEASGMPGAPNAPGSPAAPGAPAMPGAPKPPGQ